jgi:CheY-like chemotaxis protein
MAHTRKILVVEDHSDLRRLMAFFLDRIGYDVIEAETGLTAVERANATPPDLIMMDLGLPDITGDKVTAHLKANPSTKHIPVVVVTAYYGNAPLVESAIAAGACDVLSKPVSLRTLEDTLRRLLMTKPEEECLTVNFE